MGYNWYLLHAIVPVPAGWASRQIEKCTKENCFSSIILQVCLINLKKKANCLVFILHSHTLRKILPPKHFTNARDYKFQSLTLRRKLNNIFAKFFFLTRQRKRISWETLCEIINYYDGYLARPLFLNKGRAIKISESSSSRSSDQRLRACWSIQMLFFIRFVFYTFCILHDRNITWHRGKIFNQYYFNVNEDNMGKTGNQGKIKERMKYT